MLKPRFAALSLFFVLIVLVFACNLILYGCKEKSNKYVLTGDAIVDGKNLVQIHCTKCHALVPINALSNDVWQFHTLQSMSHYLGITNYMDSYFKNDTVKTGLSLNEWLSIVAYYKKLAPLKLLPARPPVPLLNDWGKFELKLPKPVTAPGVCYTTMVTINQQTHKLYTSDYYSAKVSIWNAELKPEEIATLPSPAVNVTFLKDSSGISQNLFTCIGRIGQEDIPYGSLVKIGVNEATGSKTEQVIAGSLQRPIQTLNADFNNDNLDDLVVLAQGTSSGGVYLFSQNSDHKYTPTLISGRPGAVQAITGDFNKDGYQDLMVLFGSGDEGVCQYLNDHKGKFIEKYLIHFPPVYGSTSFQLADLDHDGNLDLIYTCGYNFHDSRILKPYHGLYLFRNTGNWNFEQKYFYPINGCTKAIAADFDGDGDLDIATSAFFADLKDNPSESCIYFEQDHPFSFIPHAIPISKYGRWLSMDVGDLNNDGKPDIVLGNYSSGFMFQPGLKPFWSKNLPFIVLENKH